VEGSLSLGHEFRPYGDGPGQLIALLAKYKPWASLQDLELEIPTSENVLLDFLFSLAPTLQRLKISNTTLLCQGTWESAVLRIASYSQLNHLKLLNVCDFSPQHQGRLRIIAEKEARTFGQSELRGMQSWYRTLLERKGRHKEAEKITSSS
jgi:hypothetical protein